MKDIFVYIDTGDPVLMGVLHSEVIRGKEVFSYENDPGWLQHPRFRALDPDLSEFTGKQYLPTDKSNFGLFLGRLEKSGLFSYKSATYCGPSGNANLAGNEVGDSCGKWFFCVH